VLGDNADAINKPWKRVRVLQARTSSVESKQTLRFEDENEIYEKLGDISALIDAATQERLRAWHISMRTRGGASRWIRHKLTVGNADDIPLTDFNFSIEETTHDIAHELSARWNTGLYKASNLDGVPTSLLCGGSRELVELIPPPDQH